MYRVFDIEHPVCFVYLLIFNLLYTWHEFGILLNSNGGSVCFPQWKQMNCQIKSNI